jgi:transcription elongation factor Elf1
MYLPNTTRNQSQLRRCPFCGKAAGLYGDPTKGTAQANCMNCWASTQEKDSWREAIDAWNAEAPRTWECPCCRTVYGGPDTGLCDNCKAYECADPNHND